MSRAFALGFAVSAAIHAAVLAALWHGPSGGRRMDHDAAPGLALLWTDAVGTIRETSSSNAARPEPATMEEEESAPVATEERPPFDAVKTAAVPALAALPLPPPLPLPPRRSPQAGGGSTPGLAPAARTQSAGQGTGEGEDSLAATVAEGGNFLPASIHTKAEPAYPWEARRNRWQGTVLLAVTVSPEGRPIAIDVARSSGHRVLDDAAVEAVRQWRFVAARRNGLAVEDRVAVPITFRLRD